MPSRREYLATSTGLLAAFAGCTGSNDTTTTTRQPTTSTTESTTTDATTESTTERTTEQQTTEEQTTAEPTTNPAVEAISDAKQALTNVVEIINNFAGPNQDMTDITVTDTDLPNQDIYAALQDANGPIQRGLDHAETQSQIATLSSLQTISEWLNAYTSYQENLMIAYGEIASVRYEFYDSSPDYAASVNECEEALSNAADNSGTVLEEDTDVFEHLDAIRSDTVATKQSQLRAETDQINALADALPALEEGLSTFEQAWSRYDDEEPRPRLFEEAQASCESAASTLPDEWRSPIDGMGTKAVCVANAVSSGAATMVEASLAYQDGNTETANYRLETARGEVRECQHVGGAEQLSAFLDA